ncbi:MAG: hypothetical protein HY042_11260 [Spirochaetia bacterium]|nr:hypothetical protein [Spirochaetia bacterium]
MTVRLGAVFALLVSCCSSGGLYVKEIQSGRHLNVARAVAPEVFFQKRMENRVRKANVGNWEILLEDAEYVYFGYPVFARLLSDDRIVQDLFKVETKGLTNFFPGYRTVTGALIKPAIYARITQAGMPACSLLPREQWTFQILNGVLIARVPCQGGARYTVTLDATSGAITKAAFTGP